MPRGGAAGPLGSREMIDRNKPLLGRDTLLRARALATCKARFHPDFYSLFFFVLSGFTEKLVFLSLPKSLFSRNERTLLAESTSVARRFAIHEQNLDSGGGIVLGACRIKV